MKKLVALALTAAVSAGAFAQTFPSKSITIVVPFAAGGPTDLVARQLAVHWVRTGKTAAGVALVGISPLTCEYAVTVQSNLRFGHVIRAVLGDADPACPELVPTAGIDALETVLRNDARIELVIIGIPSSQYDRLPALLDVCDRRGVTVSLIPDAQRYLSARPAIDTIGNIALMSPMQSPLDFIARRALKRAFDVVFSLAVLIVGFPVYLAEKYQSKRQ
jgi:hypothetical protein